jgi:hypothetical protein
MFGPGQVSGQRHPKRLDRSKGDEAGNNIDWNASTRENVSKCELVLVSLFGLLFSSNKSAKCHKNGNKLSFARIQIRCADLTEEVHRVTPHETEVNKLTNKRFDNNKFTPSNLTTTTTTTTTNRNNYNYDSSTYPRLKVCSLLVQANVQLGEICAQSNLV